MYYRSEKEKVERALTFLSAIAPGLSAHISKYAVKKGMREGYYAYFDYRDGSVVISKNWLEALDHKGLGAIIAHEVLHGVLAHWIYIKEGKIEYPLIWNFACDIEVNTILEDLGLLRFLREASWKLIGAEPVTWKNYEYKLKELGVKRTDPAELIYDKMVENCEETGFGLKVMDQEGREEELGEPLWGDEAVIVNDVVKSVEAEKKRIRPRTVLWEGDKEFRKNLEESYEKFKEGMREALREAYGSALVELVSSLRSAGNVPAGLRRYVEPAKPRIRWNILLRETLKSGNTKIKRTWRVPNRRGLEYVPGYTTVSGKPWILVDTSASITDEELAQFLAEVVAAARYGKVNLVAWDAEPYVITLNASKSVLMRKIKEIRGGGGTLITPALELIYKKIRPGESVIVMTDGYWFDEIASVELMEKIKKKAGLAVLVTTYRVPVGAKEAGWKIIKIEAERP